jgi:nuclear cap-binding protein subunit 1
VGSKSLSHVLAAIERTKDRLADAGAASDAARTQIVSAVMAYWSAHPGVAICIIEKLLNYSILTPATVINWVLLGRAGSTRGEALAHSYMYEMVFNTVMKVTGRVRQVALKADHPQQQQPDHAMPDENAGETRELEVKAMRSLFAAIEDALVSWATGTKDEMIESNGDGETDKLVRRWAERWLRVFRRRAAIEEAFLVDAAKERARRAAEADGKANENANGEDAAMAHA